MSCICQGKCCVSWSGVQSVVLELNLAPVLGVDLGGSLNLLESHYSHLCNGNNNQ